MKVRRWTLQAGEQKRAKKDSSRLSHFSFHSIDIDRRGYSSWNTINYLLFTLAMVFPIVMAASGAASAGATALGLQLDAKSNDLTREVFLLQMRQSKRLFTAQWAQAVLKEERGVKRIEVVY
jgi:hypothetical protein